MSTEAITVTSARSEHLECARAMATASGEVIRSYSDRALDIDFKADSSPVTAADRESEKVMREIVRERFPDHGFIGEEFGAEDPDAEYVWIVDPIDGTKSFIAGSFDFGSVIALLHRGEPILGVIHQPVLGHLVIGNNHECLWNEKQVTMRDCSNLSDAILLATDLLNVGNFQNDTGFRHLLSQVKYARTWGNCFGYTLLARGAADIFVDPVMSPWDLLGLIPIIRGAGGVITDYHGGNPVSGRSIVAACPALHASVIELLNPRR